VLVGIAVLSQSPLAQYTRKTAIAHRGASGYAPEHTSAAYRLAIEQGADFVEQDLAVTKDGVLICLHDPSLERTTNVEDVFPDRSSQLAFEGRTRKAWLANDFTLAEIKRLDAGSWFDPRFKGEKILTFQEAIDLVRGKAGLFPELKTPEIYQGRDVHFEEKVAEALDANHLRGPAADPKTPVILQTFGEASARKLAAMKVGVPVVLLISRAEDWASPASLEPWKGVVQGFGPAKQIVQKNPDFVKWAHAAGFSVTAYTFAAGNTAGFSDVTAEMRHYLQDLGVDALFTNNPDKFPRP